MRSQALLKNGAECITNCVFFTGLEREWKEITQMKKKKAALRYVETRRFELA